MQTHQLLNDDYRYNMHHVIATLHDHIQTFGYMATELPIIVDADIFLIKAGDRIISQLFTFERNGQELALRPEFTAAAIYKYMVNYHHPSVVRWQFSGDIFVDDAAVTDFQHLAIGAELIGMRNMLADIEIMAMSALGLSALGIEDWELVIGHAGITRQVLASFNLDSITQRIILQQISALRSPSLGIEYVINYIDNGLLSTPNTQLEGEEAWLIKVSQLERYSKTALNSSVSRTPTDIARRLGEKRKRIADRPAILRALTFLKQWCEIDGSYEQVFADMLRLLSHEATNVMDVVLQWKSDLEYLHVFDLPLKKLRIKPDLTRNWEYYSGTVFDLSVNGNVVGGGGRYDGFARLIGSKSDIPAVGFAYYGDQLLHVVPKLAPQVTTVSIYFENEELKLPAMQLAQTLRKFGLIVEVVVGFPTSLTPTTIIMDTANSLHIIHNSFTIEPIDSLLNYLKS